MLVTDTLGRDELFNILLMVLFNGVAMDVLGGPTPPVSEVMADIFVRISGCSKIWAMIAPIRLFLKEQLTDLSSFLK